MSATITVDAGARWGDVDALLETYGLQVFTYPSNRMATVAGWLAAGGYGMNGFKYGHVSRHVAALEVVTPTGEIKTVREGDTNFDKYFATEGLMGIIARVTLKVRAMPKQTKPHLLYFEHDADAFRFADELSARGITPASVKFLDAHLLRLLNEHTVGAGLALAYDGQPRDGQPQGLPLHVHLEEKPALLLFADDIDTEQQLSALIAQTKNVSEAPRHIAGHMWADRFFPMQIRALGPSLLAAQVILPTKQVAPFLAEARRLAKHLHLEPATECHVITTPNGVRVLTMPMFLTDQRTFAYTLHLAFVSLLDRVGAHFEGQPYNLGIWHAPFVQERYDSKTLDQLRAFKRQQDPHNILNPGKFFRVRSRFGGITGLLFHPLIFKLAMDALMVAMRLRLVSVVTRDGRRQTVDGGRPNWCCGLPSAVRHSDITTPQFTFAVPESYTLRDLARTATECTSCGMCVSVCPAYIHTKDERVTGRAKLWLARRLANGEVVTQSEADAAWECVRCRACAEVCQAQLPLMLAWEKLEQELETRFGRPDELIQNFMQGMEKNPEYRAKVGLTLPTERQEQRWLKSRPQTTDGSQPRSAICRLRSHLRPTKTLIFQPNLPKCRRRNITSRRRAHRRVIIPSTR